MPLIRTYMYNHRKIAFERAAIVHMKQCLWVGLTCTILDVTFKRVATVCKKQYLWVGLTCTILDVTFKRVAAVCKKQCL